MMKCLPDSVNTTPYTAPNASSTYYAAVIKASAQKICTEGNGAFVSMLSNTLMR
jgi:hypothetical protein